MWLSASISRSEQKTYGTALMSGSQRGENPVFAQTLCSLLADLRETETAAFGYPRERSF
jgi:hypothetical protein